MQKRNALTAATRLITPPSLVDGVCALCAADQAGIPATPDEPDDPAWPGRRPPLNSTPRRQRKPLTKPTCSGRQLPPGRCSTTVVRLTCNELMRVRFLPPAPRNAEEYILDNLITIQVTDEQLAELQCLVAERAEDANLLERALAVPIPAGPAPDCKHNWHPVVGGARCSKCGQFLQLETL